MTTEFYEPTERGFRYKPYEVTEEYVGDDLYHIVTDKERISWYNSKGWNISTHNYGAGGVKVVTIPPNRKFREVIKLEPVE